MLSLSKHEPAPRRSAGATIVYDRPYINWLNVPISLVIFLTMQFVGYADRPIASRLLGAVILTVTVTVCNITRLRVYSDAARSDAGYVSGTMLFVFQTFRLALNDILAVEVVRPSGGNALVRFVRWMTGVDKRGIVVVIDATRGKVSIPSNDPQGLYAAIERARSAVA